MCGIFGMLRNNTMGVHSENFIEQALLQGQIRGSDGTGVALINRDKSCDFYAEAVPASSFVKSEKASKLLSGVGNALGVIGHHRSMTRGKNVDEHCHPFQFGDIVGVHNGSVPDSVLSTIMPKSAHPVDSARIYQAIAAANDPIDVLKELNIGAYALVWYNTTERTVYMARNADRPLHVLEGENCLLFASELGMLSWLSGRNSCHQEGARLSQLNTHTLYGFPIEDLSSVFASAYTATTPKHTPYSYSHDWSNDYSNYTRRRYSQNTQDVWGIEDDAYEYTLYAPNNDRAPEPLPSVSAVTYGGLTHAITAFPSVVDVANIMRDNMVIIKDVNTPVVQFAPLYKTTNIRGEAGYACAMVKWDTCIILYEAPLFIPTYALGYPLVDQLMEGGPTSKNNLNPKLSVSIMEGRVSDFYITCDGQLTMRVSSLGQRPKDPWLVSLDTKRMRTVVTMIEKPQLKGSYLKMGPVWRREWEELVELNELDKVM